MEGVGARPAGEVLPAHAGGTEAAHQVAQARALVAPAAGSPYALRYHAALQQLPEAVLAHRDLMTLLRLQRPASTA